MTEWLTYEEIEDEVLAYLAIAIATRLDDLDSGWATLVRRDEQAQEFIAQHGEEVATAIDMVAESICVEKGRCYSGARYVGERRDG